MRVIETHISKVLLHGAWAYKVKKPVRLPFLDFSTVQQRRHFSEEELRLNVRTAPHLYVDVRPLSVSWDAFVADPEAALAGSDPSTATDWVLRMHRFDDAALLSTRCVAGALTGDVIDRLARHVARFHMGLTPVAADWKPRRPFIDWLQAAFDGVLAHPQRASVVTAAEVQRWHDQCRLWHAHLTDWMAERQRAGWVREGHGDLHLSNLIAWNGEVMAFDAVEFDEDLRRIDVMNDAAFTLMDLLAHKQPALAWRFMSGWLDETGDVEAFRGWRLFVAYRAAVRAHVSLLGSGGPPACARYIDVLRMCMAESPRPRLWLMMGLSGSGKSTVAAMLRDALAETGRPVVRIRSDVERKRGLAVEPTARPTPVQLDTWYGPAANAQTRQRLQQMAATLLSSGVSVVVDVASLRRAERQAMAELADRHGANYRLWACSAPASALVERLQARAFEGLDPSDAGVSVMERQRSFMESLSDAERWTAVSVVNDGDLHRLASQVARAVAGGPP